MTAIEPGDEFEIEYGRGHRLTVRALSGRQKRRVADLFARVQGLSEDPEGVAELYNLAEQLFKLAVPDATDELIDTLDEEMQLTIASKVLAKAAASPEEKKS